MEDSAFESYENISRPVEIEKPKFKKKWFIIAIIVIYLGLIFYSIYKLRSYEGLKEENITNYSEEKVTIPNVGERIINQDGSEIALGKVKKIEGVVIYIELNNETLSIRTNESTEYVIAYSKPGAPEIKSGSFEDIEIGNILSVVFIEMEDGSLVSQNIVINK